ncbi:hypothetical protein C0146_00055 [Moraxella catarrhalis]|uniref:ubiquinone biosynthesis accessory factor UbiJ n=1 Tax=Moraxella catarrhalis TaxID=480 RepID=UPI00128C453F|nr:hypothetical protein [Moraxella catarrhalis]MPW95632.1 hypothetical protein [Moraxella catarrhalis]
MMIGVLSLAVGEKLVNTAIGLDPLIQSELKNLSGKTLRVMMRSPNLSVDVLFGDERVRLEPAFELIFEPQGGIYPNPPECTLTVDNPKHLLALLQNPTGNLPIQGDHQILMRTKYMLEQCHPDIWSWLERLIGQDAVSQLYFIGQEISPLAAPIINHIKQALASFVSHQASSNESSFIDQTLQDKKQTLLRLQSEIERSQAKLAEIQNTLNQNN